MVVLIVSLTLNIIYISRYYSNTDELFSQFKEQLIIADEGLRFSVESKNSIKKQQYYLSAHRALARARIISELIGINNSKYQYDRNGALYFSNLFEMDWILEYATYSDNKEKDLNAASEIFSVYVKHIVEADSVKDINIMKKTMKDIHEEIINNNMLPANIGFPFN